LAGASLTAKFLLELFALALLAYWGAATGNGALSVVLAIAAPVAMMVVWGAFAAPRSTRRLKAPARIPFELAVFALAAAAGYIAGATVPAIVFAAMAAANAIGLTLLRQWEA
jgi:hypothetical protein